MLAFALLLFAGCAKDPGQVNQIPVLHVDTVYDGLKVTVTGSASDADGTVAGITINWGDKVVNQLVAGQVAAFEVSHIYAEPGTWQIMVTARDDAGDSSFRSITVSPEFRETSLANIKSGLYKSSANEYLILTINLHTYQESRQAEKLNMIADVIGKMDVDFIAFQECAQNKASAIINGIIREDNMADLITRRIMEKYAVNYHYVWNWAHYGWSVWEEGVAVLSKYPVIASEDRYVSTSTGTGSITSRKVMFASCNAPGGLVNMFSAHTHWRTSLSDEEQNNQVNRIKSMVTEKEMPAPDAVSFVCGDFNGNPTSDFPWSEGYNTMMKTSDYADSFLEIYPDANQKPAQSIYNTIGGELPGRIDYIFVKKDPRLTVLESQIIFTGNVVGVVSDHFGMISKVRVIE
jgi:maltose 6'-phosphate phosphatase